MTKSYLTHGRALLVGASLVALGAGAGAAILWAWNLTRDAPTRSVEVRLEGATIAVEPPSVAMKSLEERVGFHVLTPRTLPERDLSLAFVDSAEHEGRTSAVTGYASRRGEDGVVITIAQTEGAGFAPLNRAIPPLEEASDQIPAGMEVWRVPGGVQDIYWFRLPDRGYFITITGRLYFPASLILDMVRSMR